MNRLERVIHSVRHSSLLENSDWLWNRLRTPYEKVIGLKKSGLARNINGSDPILVDSKYRQLPETYEPELWPRLMDSVRPGDVVADVGAFVGIYSVALAQRAGLAGRVIAIEPDPENFEGLQHHVALNGVEERIRCIRSAAGRDPGVVRFRAGRSVESSVTGEEMNSIEVQMTTLDEVAGGSPIDLVKVDVEGYELDVVEGAEKLMSDREKRPRAFFVELHQFAWADPSAYAARLTAAFDSHGYRLSDLAGAIVDDLQEHRWLVAEA